MDFTNYGEDFFNVTGGEAVSTKATAAPLVKAPPKPTVRATQMAATVVKAQNAQVSPVKPTQTPTQQMAATVVKAQNAQIAATKPPVIPPKPQLSTPVVLSPKVVTPAPPKPSENLPTKAVEPKYETTPEVEAPQKTPLPTFPNFANLDCAQLNSQISAIESTLATSRFSDANVRKAYDNALLSAKTAWTKKSCGVTPKPTEEKPKEEEKPSAPVGGGGGGGSAPAEEAPAEEATAEQATAEQANAEQPKAEQQAQPAAKKTNWLPILLIAGVALYLLTRKD